MLVSLGIIGVVGTALAANISLILIYVMLAVEIFILIVPTILYYATVLASEETAKKILRVK